MYIHFELSYLLVVSARLNYCWKYLGRRLRFTHTLCLLLLLFAATGGGYAQTAADSLEIYDPFTQTDDVMRILDTHFASLLPKDSIRIGRLNAELEQSKLRADKHQTAVLLMQIGEAYVSADDNNLGLQYYFRALKIAEELNDTILQGLLCLRIGGSYTLTEAPLQTDYTARGAALLRDVQSDEIQAQVYYALCKDEPDAARSDSLARIALALQRRVYSERPHDTAVMEHLSKCLNALLQLDEAIAIAEKAGSTRLTIFYVNNAGAYNFQQRRYAQSLHFYQRALRLSKENRMKGLLKNTYHNISKLYERTGNYKAAAKYLQLHALTRESQYRANNLHRYVENIVRYEVEAKETANSNLRLEKEDLERGLFSARVLEVLMLIGLMVFAVFLMMGVAGRKKLRAVNALLLEQKNQIDASKLKLEAAHRELQESETNLKSAQQLARVANWEWDSREDSFSFSDTLPELYGVRKDDLVVHFRKTILGVIHPDDRQKIGDLLAAGIWFPGEHENSYRIVRYGKICWVQAKFMCVPGSVPGSMKLIGTLQDITLLKEKEEARIRMESEQQFAVKLIEQQEAERKRIAFDIHDGIGQELVAVQNQVELALTERDPSKAAVACLQLQIRTLPAMLQELRRISQNLRPVHLERMGLTDTILETIRQAESISNIEFISEIENVDNILPVAKELHVFRIIQEAVSNIQKHSAAKHVYIEVKSAADYIALHVRDDGKGFDIRSMNLRSGFGLHSMASRAQMLGSSLSIVSAPGEGTTLRVRISVGTNGK